MKKIQLNVLEYLEESAKAYPHKLAYSDHKDDYSFRAFRNAAMSVGTAINKRAGSRNRPVAVFVNRELLCLVAMAGVLYSGNFYVPIDSAMPKKRLERMFARLDPELILYGEEQSDIVVDFSDSYDLLSVEEALIYEPDERILKESMAGVLDIDPAYVMYTSGSTGEPKGIVVTHRGLIDFVEWMADSCEINEKNVFGNMSSFYFDGSVKDVYLTMKCGGTMHVVPKSYENQSEKIVEYLNHKGVNTLLWSTASFNKVADSGVLSVHPPKYVKKLVIGGDVMLVKNLNAWQRALPDAEIINVYGPTEATVDCTYYKIERSFEDYEAIPIGKACENKEIILLNEHQMPAGKGELGEICVRGIGLAKGYYNDLEKTEAAFVQNPLNRYYPDLLYRTGDIGMINDNGEIIFKSRADGQIKHMGHRLELGEIEQLINNVENVKTAACIFDEVNDKIVCFYCGTAERSSVEKSLRSVVPKYMFPDEYIRIAQMPVSSTGKVDRLYLRKAYLSAQSQQNSYLDQLNKKTGGSNGEN